MLDNTNKKQLFVCLLFIFTEHLKLNQMKTREIEPEKLIVGNTYFDTPINGDEMIYLGVFMGQRKKKSYYFYSHKEIGYMTDKDGTIPFPCPCAPFYEEITE